MNWLQKNSIKIIFIVCVGFVFQGYNPVGSQDKKYKTVSEKKKLFKDVGCDYSNVLDIQYPQFDEIKKIDSKPYNQAKRNYEEYTKKYAGAVQRKHLAPMYLQWISDVVGYGVFAAQDIKRGDFIGEYSGVLRLVNDEKDNLDYAWYYTLDGLNNKKLVIDGKNQGNELRFINHASHPNTIRIDVLDKHGVFRVCYIADQEIKKDQQITVSYGDGYFNSRNMKVVAV